MHLSKCLLSTCSFLYKQKVNESELGDAVIVDVDNNNVMTEHDDLENLPVEIVSTFDNTVVTANLYLPTLPHFGPISLFAMSPSREM